MSKDDDKAQAWAMGLGIALFVAVIVAFNMHTNNGYLQCQLDEYQSNYDTLSSDVDSANDAVNNAQGLISPDYDELASAVDDLKTVDIPSTDTSCTDPSED